MVLFVIRKRAATFYPLLHLCFRSLRSSIHGLTMISLLVHIATSSACDIFLTAHAASRDLCSPIPPATCLRHLSTPLMLEVCTQTQKDWCKTFAHYSRPLSRNHIHFYSGKARHSHQANSSAHHCRHAVWPQESVLANKVRPRCRR
jgi:hypothetical protein